MKFSTPLCLAIASCLISAPVAASSLTKETQSDAEYMMRKVVEDIHERKLHSIVTDVTLDKSIHVVGRVVKFIPARKDNKTGEVFACARVSLNAKISEGKKVSAKIKRTDEICTGQKSGAVKYVANIH